MSTNAYEEKIETVSLSEALFKKMKYLKFCMITTGTGSGKTYVTIRTAWLHDPRTALLAIMPQSKVKEKGWVRSIEAFNQAMGSDITIEQFNYKQLTTKNGPTNIRNTIEKWKAEGRPIILIYDEAHAIKTPVNGKHSQQSKAAQELNLHPDIQHVIGITATPSPNSYLDWAAFFVMAGFYSSKNKFLKEQIRFYDERHNPVTKDRDTKKPARYLFKDPDKLDRLINEFTIYMDTSHLLPPIHTETIKFQLENETRFVDQKLLENFDIQEAKTSLEHYKSIRKYHQLGYFPSKATALSYESHFLQLDYNRLKQMGYIILHHWKQENPTPILIFYQNNEGFHAMRDFVLKFHEHFHNCDIQYVNGKQKDTHQPTNPYTIIFIQYMAGGAAIEFPTSKVSIFSMPTYKHQDFVQAIGRNVRAYSEGTVFHYLLEAEKTQDVLIWNVLENKEEFTKEIQDAYYNLENVDEVIEKLNQERMERLAREELENADIL